MLLAIDAQKCTGKDKGKTLRIYIQEKFQYKTGDDEQVTFSAKGMTSLAAKVLVIVSFSTKEWEKCENDQQKLNWHVAKYYAYDITEDK